MDKKYLQIIINEKIKEISNTENKVIKTQKFIILKKYIERECERLNDKDLYSNLTNYAFSLLERGESKLKKL